MLPYVGRQANGGNRNTVLGGWRSRVVGPGRMAPHQLAAYWKTQGTPVELAVPRSVLGKLSATERNRLSAWTETGLATVLEVAEGPPT